jgi:hypothetical protein
MNSSLFSLGNHGFSVPYLYQDLCSALPLLNGLVRIKLYSRVETRPFEPSTADTYRSSSGQGFVKILMNDAVGM